MKKRKIEIHREKYHKMSIVKYIVRSIDKDAGESLAILPREIEYKIIVPDELDEMKKQKETKWNYKIE